MKALIVLLLSFGLCSSLSQPECAKGEKCGCPQRAGALVPVGESIVTGDCKQRCTCKTAGEALECAPLYCPSEQTCRTIDGLTECYCPDGSVSPSASCIKPGLCRFSGDPHGISFDGRHNDFQGTCQHIIAQDNCENGFPAGKPKWLVAVENWKREMPKKKVSWVKEVVVVVDNHRIRMEQDGQVRVNGVIKILPAQVTPEVRVFDMPNYVWLTSTFGVTIMWDRSFSVRVLIDPSYMATVCGMCGDFDGDPDNDFVVGPNELECGERLNDEEAGPGDLTEDVDHFGYSWLFSRADEQCECDENTGPCPEDAKDKAESLCDILLDQTGPLEECLKVMTDNEALVIEHDCVFDSCQVPGLNTTVCDYGRETALDCAQEYNVTINWRHPDFCDLDCPANSTYTDCMPECVPACDDLDATKCLQRNVSCVEGCVCDDGFVFYEGKCLPADECGCYSDVIGGMVPVGETVLNENCTEKCTCEGRGHEMECEPIECAQNEICGVENGASSCVCKPGFSHINGSCVPDPICRCYGDPHCVSFDGKHNHFQGGCKYVMAQDNCKDGYPDGQPNWIVAIDNWRQNKVTRVSWVKTVTVVVGQDIIELRQARVVHVNGKLIGLPFDVSPDVVVHDMPNYVWVSTKFGLTVMWDGKTAVRVLVKPDYQSKVCGICGDLDGNIDNDFTVGPNEDRCSIRLTDEKATPGGQTADEDHFGFSWLYAADDEDCDCDKVPPKSDCKKRKKEKAEKKCSVLKNMKGPLAECLEVLDPEIIEGNFIDCVFDLCEVDLTEEVVVCDYAEQIILLCQEQFDVTVNWRSPDFCPAECHENAHYDRCVSSCQPSCADPKAENCLSASHCVEGCECDDGYVLSNGECIKPEECGCVEYNTGLLLSLGETVIVNDCRERCTCEQYGLAAKCVPHTCGEHQECTTTPDGVEQCSCVEGYAWIEDLCRGPAVCSCSGDPHCKQFDGGQVSYHGTCKYTLARDGCNGGLPETDPNFEVLINNARANPKRKVSRVDEVTVIFPGYDVEILLLQQGKVEVNGKPVTLPRMYKGDVHIFDMPNYLHVTSKKFGLKVQWDRTFSVRVTISPEHWDKTCGICGVYDADEGNDRIVGPSTKCMDSFSAAAGNTTSRDIVLGTSWYHSADDDDEFCAVDCENPPEPTRCDEDDEKEAKKACEGISMHFKTCLKKITAKYASRLLAECILDVCSTGETEKYVCNHAENLAAECSETYNVHEEWRSDEFCPAECPTGSVYKTCGPVCQPTCDDPEGSQCVSLGACQPGCFCREGLVFRGSRCVEMSKCKEPLYPCDNITDTGEKVRGRLQCFTCKNAKDDEDCMKTGSFQLCSMPYPICKYSFERKKGRVSKVNRMCASAPKCEEGSLGEEICTETYGARSSCNKCYYGDADVHHKCPPPVDNSACHHEKDTGLPGSEFGGTRYYFNEKKCSCEQFRYKGAGGNENNFLTKADCQETCETWQIPVRCLEEKDSGPCDDIKKKRHYYYNVNTNKCKKFRYGGCDGTANRFDSKKECFNTCKRC